MAKNAVNYIGIIPETGDSFESATQNTTGSLNGIDTKLGELDSSKLESGGYIGDAQDLKNDIVNLNIFTKKELEYLYRKPFTYNKNKTLEVKIKNIIELSKKISTDGKNTTLFEPDGQGYYGSVWTRDMSMSMEWAFDFFTDLEIKNAFEWIYFYSDKTNYRAPDHVRLDGTVKWTPGNNNDWGSRAPIDGNTYLIQMVWLHYLKTGSLELFRTYKEDLLKFINVGIPLNEVGVLSIPNDSNWFVGFGFRDTVKITGVDTFTNCLIWQASMRIAEMLKLDNDNRAIEFKEIADNIKNYLNNTFEFVEISNRRRVGFFKGGTITCTQYDIWASSLSVYLGLANEEVSKAISFNLVSNYNDFVYMGGIRQVLESNDFAIGSLSWDTFFYPVSYGTYQNGGYWTTPNSWVIEALKITDVDLAKKLFLDTLASFSLFEDRYTNKEFLEWWSKDLLSFGAYRYLTSACNLFDVNLEKLTEIERNTTVKLTTDQTLGVSAPTFAKINLNSKIKDDDMIFNDGTNSFKVIESGYYDIDFNLVLIKNTGGRAFVSLFVNNVETRTLDLDNKTSVPTLIFYNNFTKVYLNDGDVIDFRIQGASNDAIDSNHASTQFRISIKK